MDDRHHQPGISGDGHTHMDASFQDDLIVDPGGVHGGHFFERLNGGFHDKRHEGDAVSFASLELVFGAFNPAGDVGNIDFDHGGGVRRGVLAAHHMLGNRPANGRD